MRILIVEDDRDLAAALDDALRFEGYATRVAYNGLEAVRMLAEQSIDIVLLDRDLPIMSGDAVMETIASNDIPVSVLMLTAAAQVRDRINGLELGADDYLIKPFAYPELLARIRALQRRAGKGDFSGTEFSHNGIVLDTVRHTVTRDGKPVNLSPKEYGVLLEIMKADGSYVNAEELFDTVWAGASATDLTDAIKTTVYSLRRKLGEGNGITSTRGKGVPSVMTASHAADAATDSDATSEAAPVTDTAAAIAAAKDTAGGNGHTRRRRRFPWPSTFRGRLIATISIAALAMLATVIITQNIIVSQAARQQKNNIVMCTDKDTGELITVYFDKNQTSYDLDLEDAPDAVGSSATAVCSPMLSVQEDTVETSDPESTVTKIEVTHIGKTASAMTDSFITMMQFISIGTFIIFAVLSLIVSWLVGSRLSKRVAKISKQVEALKPGDLDARIAPDGSDDEIGKLIESINGMLGRLQNATEAERRFVSNASHELRTPIAAVATNLDAPLSQGRFPADVEPAIRRALAANRRGSDLVQALLTLSRIQSGVIDAEDVTALQLADFIDDELAEVEEQADKRNILVTTRDVAGDVQVQASKSLMDLAIGNLLRNAIMHNISSGTLDIAARQEHCAIIVTITNSTDETLPDDLMNLKQPFHRGEHSRISAEPGVGLGLSIADAACEAMGATLELDRPDEQSFRATITIASA